MAACVATLFAVYVLVLAVMVVMTMIHVGSSGCDDDERSLKSVPLYGVNRKTNAVK
jgi:hypothetical protein